MVNVLKGKSVTLECESNAVPPPTITWYKNGRMVAESANLRILAGGRTLQIRESEVRNRRWGLTSVVLRPSRAFPQPSADQIK